MRPIVLAASIAVLALSGAGIAGADQPPRAALGGVTCQQSSNALNRQVSVTAVMRPVAGTERMALKFELQRRAPGSQSFSYVQGGDLGQWRYPDPPTLGQQPGDVWDLTKEVVNLQPGVYRFRVSFRWSGSDQRVLGRRVLLSHPCDQS